MILNRNVFKNRAPKYMKKKKNLTGLKKETDIKIQQSETSTPTCNNVKNNQEKRSSLNNNFSNTVNQWGLKDLSGKLYTTVAEHIFFSRQDHMLGHKTNLSRFKRIEIVQNMFSNHSGIKLDINNRRKFWKFTTMWKLSNTLK